MTEAASPAKGSRPEGALNEADSSRKVREMFTEIAPSYDFLNHLLSAEVDRVWRARTARLLKPILSRPDARVLDLCCGTGDLAMALHRAGPARIFGADFAHTMLVRAREKSPAIPFLEADALRIPFAAASFDLVTTAFGFRNLANYEAGLREIARILKTGGTLAILEFTEPKRGILGDTYRWYTQKILPGIGGAISGRKSAYTYLPKSVSRFFRPQELSELMRATGYHDVEYRTWTFGTVALHVGVKS